MSEGWQPIETAPQTGDRFVAAAADTSAREAGRTTWGPDDRAAGYRAAGDVLMRLGYGHVYEGPRKP